jgi:hypothetical protein
MTNDDTWPYVIRGRHATMTFDDGVKLSEQRPWWKEFRQANADKVQSAMKDGKPDPREGQATCSMERPSRRDHMGNFLDAIRKDDTLACNVDLGCATMVAIKMGVEAWRQDKVLRWDADEEVVVAS